jgi:membrane protein
VALFGLLKDAFKEWSEDKASRLGAALAYYTIFSIGPLLVVVIAIAGEVFGDEAARGQIKSTIQGVVGPSGADMIEGMIKSANQPGVGSIAAVIGTVTLLLGAAGLFGQLKDALNTIWEVMPKPGGGIMGAIKNNFLSFTMVLGTGFLLMVSLVVNAVLAALGEFLSDTLPGGPLLWQILNYVISLLVLTLMFAMIFKVLPDVKMPWSNVWIGALFTAVLFVLGQIGLGFYFGISEPGSAFGAAGSLVLILVWIYYSAQILFFGAELTQVYAKQRGSPVTPSDNAMWITEEARAQQGMAGGDARKQRRARPPQLRKPSPWFKYP